MTVRYMPLTTVSPTIHGPYTSAPLRGRSTSFFWSQRTFASPGLRPPFRSSLPSRPVPLPSPSSTVGDVVGFWTSPLFFATGFLSSSPPLDSR